MMSIMFSRRFTFMEMYRRYGGTESVYVYTNGRMLTLVPIEHSTDIGKKVVYRLVRVVGLELPKGPLVLRAVEWGLLECTYSTIPRQ